MLIALSSLNLDFQSPELLSDERVWEYLTEIQAGRTVDPIEVYCDGSTYWLFDGFHRAAAARMAGLEMIAANITRGTYAEMEARWKLGLAALLDDLRR